MIGRRAMVCGGTQGIGRACAVQLAALGAAVTLIARNEEALRKVRDELSTGEGQEHQYICCDFNEPDLLKEKVTRHLAETGPVHILLNNSGGVPGIAGGELCQRDQPAGGRGAVGVAVRTPTPTIESNLDVSGPPNGRAAVRARPRSFV
jgi:NAD(P)-dependent dehydrogenase (short-subunit alcohol dehydrogenase family)